MNKTERTRIESMNTLDEVAGDLLEKYAVASIKWFNRLYELDGAYWDNDHVAIKQEPRDFLSNFDLFDYLNESGNYGDKYGYYLSCLKHLQEEVDAYKDKIDLLCYQTTDTGDTEDCG